MSDQEQFRKECAEEIQNQGANAAFQSATKEWFDQSVRAKYSYHFEWMGLPIIQYPQDIVAVQEILWRIKPDVIIETGIARGGSLVFHASMLDLIAASGGNPDAKVIGVDIDIREHNRAAIAAHPMSKRIEMIQGSSISPEVHAKVLDSMGSAKTVLVSLDSNHTRDHVLKELRLYAPLVSRGSYCIVFDTVIEDMPQDVFGQRPWKRGNSPKNAVADYLKGLSDTAVVGADGAALQFEVDQSIDNKILISVAPGGFLQRR